MGNHSSSPTSLSRGSRSVSLGQLPSLRPRLARTHPRDTLRPESHEGPTSGSTRGQRGSRKLDLEARHVVGRFHNVVQRLELDLQGFDDRVAPTLRKLAHVGARTFLRHVAGQARIVLVVRLLLLALTGGEAAVPGDVGLELLQTSDRLGDRELAPLEAHEGQGVRSRDAGLEKDHLLLSRGARRTLRLKLIGGLAVLLAVGHALRGTGPVLGEIALHDLETPERLRNGERLLDHGDRRVRHDLLLRWALDLIPAFPSGSLLVKIQRERSMGRAQ